ncbi:MAG: LytS/YhcK type 5TM receptor domain-containing protein [Pseudomonadota bacterium]
MWTFNIVSQFVGCLAVIGMLAVAYGATRRVLPGTTLAPTLLGVLFGAMAVVQMFQPLEIADGVIVDGRTIPVALAGAFLGLRGLLLCMAIAITARIGIGGIGWSAGVTAILVSGMAGAAWSRLTSNNGDRGLGDLTLLAAMMSSHVVGALLLPAEIALTFIRDAMPVVLMLNFIAVPAIGALLEREDRAMKEEAAARDAMLLKSDCGIMPMPEFQRNLGQLIATGAMGTRVGLITIRLVGGFRALLWGRQIRSHLLAELARLTHETLPNAAIIGEAGLGRFIVALPGAVETEAVAADLEAILDSTSVVVPGGSDMKLPVQLDAIQFDNLPSSEDIAKTPMLVGWFGRSEGSGGPAWTARSAGEVNEVAASPRLFRIAEELIAQNADARGYGNGRTP